MTQCWLYIYENKNLNSIYIGIADDLDRVFQSHNPAAEQLRDAPGSVILQTVKPFSSRDDARKAEAIAIHIAAIAGTKVSVTDESGQVFTYTNSSGVQTTKELGPAILTRPGEIQWSGLTSTVIVPISADELEGRPAPYGALGGAIFAERASKYWQITPSKRPRVTRLIALLKGSRNIILGDWDVAPEREWVPSTASPNRVTVPLIDADCDDPRDKKGMRLAGLRMNSAVSYSPDLK